MTTWLSRLLLMAATCALASGCAGPVEERLVGEWVLDIEATKNLDAIRAMPEEERRGALDSLEIRGPTFTFTEDGKVTFRWSNTGESGEANYSFVSKDGDKFVLAATSSDGKSQRMECEFDGDTLIVAMDGQAVAYKRANR